MKYLKFVALALFSLTLGGCMVVPSEPRHRIVQCPPPQVIVVHDHPIYYYSYPTIGWHIGVRMRHLHRR